MSTADFLTVMATLSGAAEGVSGAAGAPEAPLLAAPIAAPMGAAVALAAGLALLIAGAPARRNRRRGAAHPMLSTVRLPLV